MDEPGDDETAVPAGAAPAAPAFGERYRPVARISGGGQAVVYRAVDTLRGDADVVVKHYLGVDGRAARSEASWLRHVHALPGVVRLVDEGRHGGRWFTVMEPVDGDPFPGDGPLLPVVVDLLGTLTRLHRLNVTHHDLKPTNVLVRDGRCTVLDLGVAAVHGRPAPGFSYRWAAPEQLRGAPCGPAADAYAVGVLIAAAVTGAPPFLVPGDPAATAARREAATEAARCGLVDGPLGAWVGRLLHPEPDRRPSLATVLDALGGEPHHLPRAAVPAGPHTPDTLRGLFAGPDRFAHLAEDAAAELWARTGGDSDQVHEELDAWVCTELATWDGSRVTIGRPAIERLRLGLRVCTARPRALDLASRPQRVLEAVRVLYPHASTPRVAQASGGTLAELRDLQAAGHVWPLGDDHWGARIRVRPSASLPPAAERALCHLAAEAAPPAVRVDLLSRHAPHPPGLAAEVVAVAGDAMRTGSRARGSAMAAFAAHLAARTGDRAMVRAAVELATWGAVFREDHAALQSARQLLVQVDAPDADLYDDLLAAAVTGRFQGDHAAARARLPPGHLFACPELEEAVETVRDWTLRGDPVAEGRMLRRLAPWAAEAPHREQLRQRLLGLLAYRTGRFHDAVAHFEDALGSPPQPGDRANLALGLIQVGAFERAAKLARQALADAAARRDAQREAFAWWALRTAGYRSGVLDRAELEAVEDLAVAAPRWFAMTALVEAAVAWRRGRIRTAETAARWALADFQAHRIAPGVLLAAALLTRIGHRPGPFRVPAGPVPPLVALQASALNGRTDPALVAECRALLSPDLWDVRREILAPSECV